MHLFSKITSKTPYMYAQGKFSTGKRGLSKKIPNVALGLMSAALLGPVFFLPEKNVFSWEKHSLISQTETANQALYPGGWYLGGAPTPIYCTDRYSPPPIGSVF